MEVILFIILAAIIALALLIILPLRLSVYVAGDMFNGFRIDGRLHILNGFIGGGIETTGSRTTGQLFFMFRRIVQFDMSGIIGYFRKKAAGRAVKKAEKKKKPKPVKTTEEKLKALRGNMGRGKNILREFKGVFRLDFLQTHVTLGLLRPEITGVMTGFIFALNGMLPDKYDIVPRWDFTGNALSGDVLIRITVYDYILWKKLLTILPKAIAGGSATDFLRQVKQRYA